MTRVRHSGVRPGWYHLDTEAEQDQNIVVASDEMRAVQLINDVHGPGESPCFALFGRSYHSIHFPTAGVTEFELFGWVTGYPFGEEWLEGGDPGTMILSESRPPRLPGEHADH